MKNYKYKNNNISFLVYAIFLTLSFLLSANIYNDFKYVKNDLGAITEDQISAPSGSGSEEDPYKISSAEELMWISYQNNNVSVFSNFYFSLQNNIDMSNKPWESIGTDNKHFSGTFMGNGFTISNLSVSNVDYAGLFGITDNLYITDLYVKNINLNSNILSGGLVAKVSYARIEDCSIESGTISSNQSAGGLIGQGSANISSSSNKASVSGQNIVGGIVGDLSTGTVDSTINYGNISANSYAGGIAGRSSATISRCLNYGQISGNSKLGGIVSQLQNGIIDSCVNFGNFSYSVTRAIREIGAFVSEGVGEVKNSSAKSTITLTGSKRNDAVLQFGVPSTVTITNSLSETEVVNDSSTTTYKKSFLVKSQNPNESAWYYNPSHFNGIPIPSNIFWGFNSSVSTLSVSNYLTNQNYNEDKYPLLQYDSAGNYYYFELGTYPQSYVGDELNQTLINFYPTSSSVKSYANYNYSNLCYEYNGELYVGVDGNSWYKVEPIRWKILNVDDFFNGSDPLVTTLNSITANVPWNTQTSASWNPQPYSDWGLDEKIDIKIWLNGSFYNEAFTADDHNFIKTSQIGNGGPTCATNVFLLSKNEVNTYLSNKVCSPTAYASKNNCNGKWYTITVNYLNRTETVNSSGSFITNGETLRDDAIGIRPAMWLTIPI